MRALFERVNDCFVSCSTAAYAASTVVNTPNPDTLEIVAIFVVYSSQLLMRRPHHRPHLIDRGSSHFRKLLARFHFGVPFSFPLVIIGIHLWRAVVSENLRLFSLRYGRGPQGLTCEPLEKGNADMGASTFYHGGTCGAAWLAKSFRNASAVLSPPSSSLRGTA